MRLPFALEVAIPVVVFFLMWLVGLRVTRDDLHRVLARPRLVVIALLAQTLLLPLVALGTGRLMGAALPLRIALLLVAASPAGVLSNAYTLLSRGNVALSVTLTASATLLGVMTLPLVADAGLALLAAQGAPTLHIPIPRLVGELVLTILLPVGLGMALRSRVFRVLALERRLQAAGALATAVLALTILVLQWDNVSGRLASLGGAVVIFTVAATIVGHGVVVGMGTDLAEHVAVVLEFPCRNLGLVVLVAINSLGRPEVAGLASAFLLIQTPILLLAALVVRRAGLPAPLAGS